MGTAGVRVRIEARVLRRGRGERGSLYVRVGRLHGFPRTEVARRTTWRLRLWRGRRLRGRHDAHRTDDSFWWECRACRRRI